MSAEALTLNTALADYYRVRQGRYSPSTWRAHEQRLEHWRTWIIRETQPNVYLTDIADPDERLMERYFNRLRPPAYEPRSFNNYRNYLNAFWKFCLNEGWVRTNPMRHVDPLRVPRVQRLQLSEGEMRMMLDGAAPRDRIGLAVGINTALRGGDIATLVVGNVNLETDQIFAWVEKSDHSLEIPMTQDLHVEMVRWFHHYAEACGLGSWLDLPNDWTLVPPAQGVALDVNNPAMGHKVRYKTHSRYRHPEEIVHRGLERLGLPTKKEGFHTIRRSAARHVFELAIERGVRDPIRMAQAMLDHQSRATTELYLGMTHEKQMLAELLRGQSFLHGDVRDTGGVSAVSVDRSGSRPGEGIRSA